MTGLTDKARLAERVDFRELEQVLEDYKGQGIIFVTGHLGSWEVAGALLSSLRDELHVIGRRVDNPFIDRIVKRGRRAMGIMVHERRGGIRELKKALDRNKDIGLLLDQNQRKRGIFVPVFGKLASTDRSAAMFALRYSKPVVIGFAVRSGYGFRFRIVMGDVVIPTRKEMEEMDVTGLTVRIVKAMEEKILLYPDQYLWMHDRYKTRPPSEKHDRK